MNKYFSQPGLYFFKITICLQIQLRENRDSEKTQKVHSFKQQTCQGLEIWNAPSLCGIPQIQFSDFENLAFWLFYVYCSNECTFCDLSVSRFKGLNSRSVFTCYRDFRKIITQAKKNIFSCGFLHLVHLNKIFKINFLDFWTLQTPLTPLSNV